VKLGLQIPNFTWSSGPTQLGTTLAEIARTADDVGFEFISVMDHFWQIRNVGAPELDMLECYTTLGFLAAHSKRAKLLGMVTGNPYRHPGVLAKTVTTLDVLSGGRAWLGIGAGWNEEEAQGLGIPFPPMKVRFEMLEETLQICLRMWSGERGDEQPFQGKHYQLARALNSPQSLSRPHPPILIGGSGEQKTLRFVARYADACNLFPTPDLPRKLEVLRERCEEEGRDYDSILKTCIFHFDVGEDGSKSGELIETLRGFAGMGIQGVIGAVEYLDRITPLEVIGREVIPEIADL
jgi:F420-dependent oxidoreductase-like protein